MGQASASFIGSAASAAQFPRDGLPEVAFLGRSNVGKSSLLNALAGTKTLARVSSTPGRTRLVNFFHVQAPALNLYFVDLPGYGYARVSETERLGFEKLVTSYLVDRAPLLLCVFLMDVRHPPMPGDETLAAFLAGHHLPFAIAATKADKLSRGGVVQRLRAVEKGIGREATAVVAASAVTRDGVDEIWTVIRAAVNSRQEVDSDGR